MEDVKEAILGLAIWALAERTGCTFHQARKVIDEEFREQFSTSSSMTSTIMIHILHGARIKLES